VFLRRIIISALCLLFTFALVSCNMKSKNSFNLNSDSEIYTSGAQTSVTLVTVTDLDAEAKKLSSSTGRVALALIICKLDPHNVFEELSQKNAKELFDTLIETASRKSQTLEAIDGQFNLKDILASEKIYVTIKSNAVTSNASPTSSTASTAWITPFMTAINGDGKTH